MERVKHMSKYKFNQNDFDPEFLNIMGGFAEALEVDLPDMMQRMLIKRFAYDRAILDVIGTSGPGDYAEFIEVEDLEPKKLFQILYNMKRQELEREELARIQDREEQIGFDQLPENEQEFLKQRGQDRESRAARKEQKQKDDDDIQALIDSGDLILDENQTQPKDKKSIYEE